MHRKAVQHQSRGVPRGSKIGTATATTPVLNNPTPAPPTSSPTAAPRSPTSSSCSRAKTSNRPRRQDRHQKRHHLHQVRNRPRRPRHILPNHPTPGPALRADRQRQPLQQPSPPPPPSPAKTTPSSPRTPPSKLKVLPQHPHHPLPHNQETHDHTDRYRPHSGEAHRHRQGPLKSHQDGDGPRHPNHHPKSHRQEQADHQHKALFHPAERPETDCDPIGQVQANVRSVGEQPALADAPNWARQLAQPALLLSTQLYSLSLTASAWPVSSLPSRMAAFSPAGAGRPSSRLTAGSTKAERSPPQPCTFLGRSERVIHEPGPCDCD